MFWIALLILVMGYLEFGAIFWIYCFFVHKDNIPLWLIIAWLFN
jgi:hypothetical protein